MATAQILCANQPAELKPGITPSLLASPWGV